MGWVTDLAMSTVTMAKFETELLNTLLGQELAKGNSIADEGPGWGSMKRLVILRSPFHCSVASLHSRLSHHEVNDPHYWKAEIVDSVTNEMLACRFG